MVLLFYKTKRDSNRSPFPDYTRNNSAYSTATTMRNTIRIDIVTQN